MMTKTFKGAKVFMSRNLVQPETFDTLHDALKHNGAEVFLCCDPSRNGPNDYHVISSRHHEKFDDLRSGGCNLLGPQCVLSCAKECRPLPRQGFTCCLAMDGVKILASGFEVAEKAEIEQLVTAMGGAVCSKTCLDVSFVIVKNVSAAKYKWALNTLKKPIVTLNWLHQCWQEHRVVPQESYKVLPFSGLTICVTRIPADERKEMEKLVIQNGGRYSAELTKKCTHLVCDAPEGDKYKVARRWGHIYIVTRKWFDQSAARRACLNEESYPVQGTSATSVNTAKTSSLVLHSQGNGNTNLQTALSSGATDSTVQANIHAEIADPDVIETTLSQNMSTTFSDVHTFRKEDRSGTPAMQPTTDTNFEACVADDSQTEDNDLYLSDCRILLVGFDSCEMRKVVNMVRRGGGSRYMSFNEKLTHIVVGTPSEIEKKELRGSAALGVIYVVRIMWLEDCDHEKKEVPVHRRHIANDLLFPKDPMCSNKEAFMGSIGIKGEKPSSVHSILLDNQLRGDMNLKSGIRVEKSKLRKVSIRDNSLRARENFANQSQLCALDGNNKTLHKVKHVSSHDIQNRESSSVFHGTLFRFSASFPQNRRAEIIEWVKQGGGEVVDDHVELNVEYTVECHGVMSSSTDVTGSINISSHWIRSCLEDGHLLDVNSHILFSPLPCRVPLPGFERFRFCVSQYDEKDRALLRNLCFVLGAKFVEKLTKKVTHLLCKFSGGPKYEAACKWGIKSVTSEWIYECVKQNEVVAPGTFCPKEASSQDQEAGLCTMSQYPTTFSMILRDSATQLPSQSQDVRNGKSHYVITDTKRGNVEAQHINNCNKKARLVGDEDIGGGLYSGVYPNETICKVNLTDETITKKPVEVSNIVPDVAAAIEDLLEQTSKIHDPESPGKTSCDKTLPVLAQHHIDSHSAFGLTKHWLNRNDKQADVCIPSGDVNMGIYDGFSETQTESQVVGYEEDLSGRQMIIDRVRTRSSMI